MDNFFNDQTFVEGDIKHDSIIIEDELGRGNSRVHAVRINGCRYAMKQLLISNDYQYHNFLKEISMLKTLSARNSYLVAY